MRFNVGLNCIMLMLLSSHSVKSSWGDAACLTLSSAKDPHLPTMDVPALPPLHQDPLPSGRGLRRDPPEPA